ncbi:MAG: heavy metal-binding domain-containing protein [Actinomycetota bacterium]|nr:heavy metal-binding domain-containing protein [Actinomycetota bacterium]
MARLRQSGPRDGAETQPGLFTSDLSVNEFALLHEAGFAPLGLVLGSSIYHVGYQFQVWNQSQELQVLTQAMYTAREYAIARMEAEADALGADGIVGVRLDYKQYSWGEDLIEFLAVGTAVRSSRGGSWRTPAGKPFTSDLSGQDMWTLVQTGHTPVSFVLGTCVYHVAHQSFRQSWKTVGQNTEMPNFTQATYDAREIAMARMQAEAERDGASGIVGVRVIENNHVWGAHAIEFLALGTSIRRLDEEAALPSPTMVMPMTD